MEGESAPVAAAPATEQTPTTNSNPAPESAPAAAPASAPAITAEQVAQFFGTTPEMASKMQSFYSANGGVKKVEDRFAQVKQAVSNPAPQPQPQPAQVRQPRQQSQPQGTQSKIVSAPSENKSTRPGVVTQQDMVMKMFFDSIANRPEYANISDQLRSGEFFKWCSSLGSSPFEIDGNINQGRLSTLLATYSKTQPAVAPSTPEVSSIPTANFTNVGEGGIKNRDEALKIFQERGNPNHQAAVEWLRKDRAEIMKGKR